MEYLLRPWSLQVANGRSFLLSELIGVVSAHILCGPITLVYRFILIEERFFKNIQSLEKIGDMYQYTEAFCHYS